MAKTRPEDLERAGVEVTEENLRFGLPSSAVTNRMTPGASVAGLLAGARSEPEVDPRMQRRGLELIARAFREIGVLKGDVGKLKQVV